MLTFGCNFGVFTAFNFTAFPNTSAKLLCIALHVSAPKMTIVVDGPLNFIHSFIPAILLTSHSVSSHLNGAR